ncbi:MAG: hypothetical protein GKR93_08090 [Gammaproteobacteria bacterium]|nr:hypothetical protein [Gammaproteobacteria bacterium]
MFKRNIPDGNENTALTNQEGMRDNIDAYSVVERNPGRRGPFKIIIFIIAIFIAYHIFSPVKLSLNTEIKKREASVEKSEKKPMKVLADIDSVHQIVSNGRLEALTEILQKIDRSEINRVENGMTPIMLAASKGNVEMIDLLYTQGADPNKRGSMDRTALQYATEKNHYEAAKRLLSYGADIDAYDNGRLTSLTMAANRGHSKLALLLVKKGADPNIQHSQGWTALIDATIRNDEGLVRALLAAGADKNIKMKNGMKALDYAIQYNHKKMSRLLSQ